jgi:hypothetical protein
MKKKSARLEIFITVLTFDLNWVKYSISVLVIG